MKRFCEDNQECIFDYMTTVDEEIAMDTKIQHFWTEQVSEFSQPGQSLVFYGILNFFLDL